MKEAQLWNELRILHNRCDNLTTAVNHLTDAVSNQVLIVRSYENLINRSWILSRLLPRKKVMIEAYRVNDLEGELFEKQKRLLSRMERVRKENERRQAEQLENDRKVEKREKLALKMQKKAALKEREAAHA